MPSWLYGGKKITPTNNRVVAGRDFHLPVVIGVHFYPKLR